MRITVVARHPVPDDPHTAPLLHTLATAGHELSVVSDVDASVPTGARVVPPAAPARLARLLPASLARRAGVDRDGRARAAIAGTDPSLVRVLRSHDLALVDGSTPVLAPLSLGRVPGDLRWSAPTHPDAAADHVWSPWHTPDDDRPPSSPTPGRHTGRCVAIVGRLTSTNPSRYLRTGLVRAGVEVVALDGVLDWDAVPPHAEAVVVVESPWPALPVTGRRPAGVPLLFWVHHGEHHLPVNLRLAGRYGADAVLLAHSWHLAHRFPVPVHRFPFAVATEVFDGGLPWGERDLDVAVVGAGLGARTSPRYPRRAAWTEALAPLGDRAALVYGLTPAEMARLYGRSRLVLNEGGNRHLPITMRVFEAVGAGARLVTDELPGTDLLLGPGGWERLRDDDLLELVRTLAADPATGGAAAGTLTAALGRHTYDHRVDELLDVVARTELRGHRPEAATDPLAAAMVDDVEVQTVAALDSLPTLPDRAVATGEDAVRRLAGGRFDAVVVADVATVAAVGGAVLADRARRYLYCSPAAAAAVDADVPGLVWTDRGPWRRVDRDGPGYRVRDADHPLAG